jgi:formate-dependent nitrite reductase membrane component NrfD
VIRENPVHWDTLVYLEMFVAGIAAGAYVTASLLELLGRGRSPIARTAHLIAFPLMALASILLIVDLDRPERFWHMIVMNQAFLPMFKPWSVISLGVWLVLLFPAFAFVSFVDAVIARRVFTIGGWRADRTLHGTPLGLVWSIIGGLLALAVGAYSGVLLSATNFAWANSSLIGALFVATAIMTGMAAVLLIEALRGATDPSDLQGLSRATTAAIIWWMVILVLFVATLGAAGFSVFLVGGPLLAIIGAAVLGGILPLILLVMGASRRRPSMAALVAVLILIGGLLLRYGVVMGAQPERHIPGVG